MRRNIVLIFIAAVVLAGCQAYDAPYNPQPVLEVADATDITRTDATIAGTISHEGGDLPHLRFEWWQADGSPLLSPQLIAEEGRVSYRLQGLKPGATYRYRLKGSNERVEMTSGTREFQTRPNVLPTVSGLTALAKGPASLIASFTIEDDGGEDITEAGCHIRNTAGGNDMTCTADITGITDNTVTMTMINLERNATLEITPYAANTIGETKGTPLIITTDNTVSVPHAGMLSELIGNDRMGFTSISFSGDMNGDDIRTLREMAGMDFDGNATAGQLADIDLTDARLVEGGGNYIPSRYVSNDVVGYGMFQNLSGLRSIKLPNTVTTIEEQAFMGCDGLRNITIPAEVTALTPSDGCTSLEAINVSPANRNYKSVDGVLFDADVTGILWFPLGKSGDYSLPATVTAIGDYAFRNCNITHFTMPDNITKIGMAAFTDSKVQSVTLSAKLTTVPQSTFQGCTSLTEVHLGSATELIGSFAFDGCPLTDIYLEAVIPPVCNSSTFSSSYDLMKLCRLHVPEASRTRYRNHSVWGKFEKISR